MLGSHLPSDTWHIGFIHFQELGLGPFNQVSVQCAKVSGLDFLHVKYIGLKSLVEIW